LQLFVYGTLIEGLARGEAARLVEGNPAGAKATISGELRLIEEPLGCYPILVAGAEGRVVGQILDCPDDPAWIEQLDAYEGPDFRRWTVTALLADGSELEVQAYIGLIAEPDELERVPDGDFARFIARTGRNVFGGAESQ
jgi:gamma-glutamylcyclotransferase (GGCT)/AIG2-like uncharacterized protein YtfP